MSKESALSPDTQLIIELITRQERRINELVELIQDISTPHKKFLSVRKFAEHIGWSPSHVRNLCERGKLKAIQPVGDGGQWKIWTSELPRMKQLMKEEAEANLFDDHKPRKRSVS
jgi:hypothetical protein